MITIASLEKELKLSPRSLRNRIKKLGLASSYQKVNERRTQVVSEEDAEAIKASIRSDYSNPIIRGVTSKSSYQDKVALRYESEGCLVLRMYASGAPDLIVVSKKLLQLIKHDPELLMFVEVKGVMDGLRKEQYFTLEKLRDLGLVAKVDWE